MFVHNSLYFGYFLHTGKIFPKSYNNDKQKAEITMALPLLQATTAQPSRRFDLSRLPLFLAGLLMSSASLAQPLAEAWFGLMPPPAFQAHALPAILGERMPPPARIPPGEEQWQEFDGARLMQDLRRIVQFSFQSREARELGSGQLWGRVSGFPSASRTVEWVVEQYREAGIRATEIQRFRQDSNTPFWMPLSWQVRLLARPEFGVGSEDIILDTAMPLSPSEIPDGPLRGQLVYVGKGSIAELSHIDVRGKIAVQQITPQAHMVFERDLAVPNAQEMFRRGAIAVLNIVDLPGNERARDFSNCGGPCFNLGGRDGHFLTQLFDRAATAGSESQLEVELQLQTTSFTALSAQNGIGVIPGKDSSENFIINAHIDAWFDGAGDNGDGMAVQLALARHFARPENRLSRTLIFVASAGHHSPGMNGPRNFVRMNPGIVSDTLLTLNIEHVAQRNLSPARSLAEDGYREYTADAAEAPIVAGVTNGSPFLEQLFVDGTRLYGPNFVSGTSTMASGEGGGYRDIPAPIVTLMQAPPLYHTSGEVLEAISEPGLERVARFLAYFIKALDQASREQIAP